MRILIWARDVAQDVRHAVRLFARSPGFALIAILSIACGTGANVAIFSVADTLLLRPGRPPQVSWRYREGSRVVVEVACSATQPHR